MLMKKIFVIGNIGCGKSTFCRFLYDEINRQQKKVAYISLDKIGQEVLSSDEINKKLIDVFGVFNDKKQLAKKVFSEAKSVERLNEITHPYIYKKMLSLLAQYEEKKYEYAIVEQSVYVGDCDIFSKHADKLICVACKYNMRKQRCLDRGMSLEDFEKRNQMQISEDAMMRYADIKIENFQNTDFLKKQVKMIVENL